MRSMYWMYSIYSLLSIVHAVLHAAYWKHTSLLLDVFDLFVRFMELLRHVHTS